MKSVEGTGPGGPPGGLYTLFLMERDLNKTGQLWQYGQNQFVNQGRALDTPFSSMEEGAHIGTFGRHIGPNQQWHVYQE